jgi:hypothetical protein
MVNGSRVFRQCCAVLVLGALVLGAAAWQRGAEYDEQYTLFLTAGAPRPAWPEGPFPAGQVRTVQAGHANMETIASDLRRTDVHPPLYFWVAGLWRQIAGSGLFAARLLPVGFSLGALAGVGLLARRLGVSPMLAMVLTLGCYGFTYTGSVARGFALAQMLSVAGVICALEARQRRARALAAGVLFGAAAATNYLAVFVAVAVALTLPLPLREGVGGRGRCQCGTSDEATTGTAPSPRPPPVRGGGGLLCGFLPFLALDLWFFLAQRNTRAGQFPPFHLIDSLARLARYSAATLFGGLPLYTPETARPAVTLALAGLAVALVGLVIYHWRRIGPRPTRWIIAAAAIAPPLGLLALGLIFNNTPIELRYLSFSTPFIALLLAGVLAHLPRIAPTLLLTLQAAAIAGLILRPETMQPARATAAAAVRISEGGVILLPYGNDGVGIVGAFALEAPPDLLLITVRPGQPIRPLIAGFDRVVLARMAQDDSSRVVIPQVQAALSGPCWRAVAEGFNVTAYQRVCAKE